MPSSWCSRRRIVGGRSGDGIGDFSEAARQAECACVLPGLEDLGASREAIHAFCSQAFTAEQRAAFSGWGAERFAIELYVPQLAALYRSLGRTGAADP